MESALATCFQTLAKPVAWNSSSQRTAIAQPDGFATADPQATLPTATRGEVDFHQCQQWPRYRVKEDGARK
jgi:hypothetical protein